MRVMALFLGLYISHRWSIRYRWSIGRSSKLKRDSAGIKRLSIAVYHRTEWAYVH